MPHLDAFFNPHDGLTTYTDGFGSHVGTDMPDHMGGINHTDGNGALTHHSHSDHMGGTQVHDARGHLVAHIRHDVLGHTHVTGEHGQELVSARPNVFHGHDLFLPTGQHVGAINEVGVGHLQFQADPLVGMGSIRFPQFA